MENFDPSLRYWIAENLLNGAKPEELMPPLLSLNISTELAWQEIMTAQNHPYLQAARQTENTVGRRESLLRTLDFYKRMDPNYLKLERQPLPPFQTFLQEYYYQNRPGLFTGAIDHWPAMQWTPRKLVERVGTDTMVEVQGGREGNKEYELAKHKHTQQMRFGDFINIVENNVTNDVYLTANNAALQNPSLSILSEDIRDIGDGYLNMAEVKHRMFLWIGPKGTITPLHHDLTHNLFMQVYGSKRFHLIPTMQVPYIYNQRAVFSRVDLLDPQPQHFPLFKNVTPIDITVHAGDFLYIPIGWIHHVIGESVSISLSFTSVNAPNYFLDYPG